MRPRISRFVTRFFKPEFIFGNVFIPTALLLGYCGLFIALNRLLSSYLFPDNVNYHFVRDLIMLAVPVLLASLLALLLLSIRRREAPRTVAKSERQAGEITASLLIALIPLAPVIRYLFSNQDILSPRDAIVLLAACLGASIVLVVVFPALLGKYSSFRLLVSVTGAFVFTIVNMAAISGLLHWLEEGSTKLQLPLLVLVLAIMWLLLGLQNKRELTFVVVVFLASNVALITLNQSETSAVERTQKSSLEELLTGRRPTRFSNIYLLVYDAYVPNETMLNYGIDNAEQEAFLVEQGFKLYPHTYSVGADSLGSMNRVFNVSLVHNGHSRDGVSGNGVVHELLRSIDYQIFGIFPYDYMFRGVGPQYDYYIPQGTVPSYQLLFAGIWMGEFRYDIGLDTISHEEYIQAKREVFTTSGENPVFVYTHSSLPGHSQNSGICLSNEIEMYGEKLLNANLEMREDIAAIIANDPSAIVIVAGDHGPYLTKNCTQLRDNYDLAEITRIDILDRHSSFLAIRWPTEDYSEYDQITVLQDIFPAIFSWMYRDSTLLDARIEPITVENNATGGVVVKDGIIVGGADDGQPLFLSGD